MDSYILPGLPFLPSFQETIATAEPLSAGFLKYQLSRTPAPKRFSRNANRAPRPHLDPGTPRNEDNFSLTKTDFRPASENIPHDVAAEAQDGAPGIAKRWPVPRHVTAAWAPHEDGPVDSTAKSLPGSDRNAQMSAGFEKSRLHIPVDETDDFTLNDVVIREAAVGSKIGSGRPATANLVSTPNVPEDIAVLTQGHGQERHLSGSLAEKTALKRPKKRHPLPSTSPVRQQRAALAGILNNRQFSIPGDERPAKAKDQKRPRIAKNLPVDELELAEERLVLSYDAPPMSSSDEADSDPVEESPSGRVRRLRNSKKAIKHSARPIKKKQKPIRSSRKRPLTLSEFKVIKPQLATVGANEKKISSQPAIGDGFEGSELLPTGRHSCPTKPKRRPRQQVTRPTLYYRALEIVEVKPFDMDLNTNQGTPEDVRPRALDFATDRRESRDAVASMETLPDELLVELESSSASPIVSENVVMTIHAVDIKHGNQQHQQAMEILKAPTQPDRTQPLLHNNQLQPAEIDEDPAAVLPGMEEGEKEQDEEENPQSSPTVLNPVSTEALPSIREDIKAGTTPQADDGVQQYPVETRQQMAPPPGNPSTDGKKKIPPTKKIKRQVTFSDEVKIQRVVEPESEEEYESESEEQSQEYDSESDKSHSTDSEEEKLQQEDNDSDGSDDGADDKGDDEEGDCYPTTKLDDRLGSPELVSSGYYVRSSSPAESHFSFHADRTESVASIAKDDDSVEGDMILDMDEELEELSDPPSYTPQSKKYFNDEMLIPTSRATSAERMLMPSSDGVIETDYGEEEPSDNLLAMQPRLSYTVHGPTHKPITQGSDENLNGTGEAFYGVARLSWDLQINLADSGIGMMPQTSFAVSEQDHGSQTRSVSPPASRKIKRAKTGLTSKQHSDPSLRQVLVRDVPSYFTPASQVLSSPLKNVQVMMRRAKTLPATQYVSESGDDDEEGFIISNESFRNRLHGRKRHLSLSYSVDYSEQMVLRKSHEEMGRIGVIRKRKSTF